MKLVPPWCHLGAIVNPFPIHWIPRRDVEVRTSLLSFGKPDPARPFGWLAEDAPAGAAAPASGLSGLAQLGSSLGGLASAAEATEEIPEASAPEVDRWSAALPVYNDFEL